MAARLDNGSPADTTFDADQYALLFGGKQCFRNRFGVADMQLTGEQLVKAYRSTRTIRVFEERVHKLFATGQILGFVHQSLSRHASRSQPFNR
jgi:hypothetical protein